MNGLIKDKQLENILNYSQTDNTSLKDLPKIQGELKFTRTPMPYQEEFARICPSKKDMILALDTGMGKSLAILWRLNNLNVKSMIVVGINAVDSSWRTSIREVYGIETTLYNGDPPEVKKLDKQFASQPLPNFLFCTYETIQKLIDRVPEGYYEHIILDEAHLVSHEGSKRYIAVKQLIDKHPEAGKTAVTGTPIQDKPRDLWGIVSLLNPKMAGSFDSWVAKYERVVHSFTHKYPLKTKDGRLIYGKDGKQKWGEIEIPLVVETQNLDDLTEKLKSIMFRVDTSKYINYKSHLDIKPIPITYKQKRIYDSVREEILVELSNRTLKVQGAAVRMMRLLQVSEGIFNIDEEDMESSKLDYLVDYLSTTKEKVVVWSRFQAITNILGEKFKDKGVVYNGDVSKKNKMLRKWAFNGVYDDIDLQYYKELQVKTKDYRFSPGEAQFFFGVIDLRSAAGIDLHRSCYKQIFSSFSFMHAANYQAAARLLRLGQPSDEVFTTYLVGEGTIEYSALTHVLNKYETVLKILDGKEAVSYKTNQELIKLLRAS